MTPYTVKTARHVNTLVARGTYCSQRVCAKTRMGARVIQASAHLVFWWWREDLNLTAFWLCLLRTRWWGFPKEQEGAGCFASNSAPVFRHHTQTLFEPIVGILFFVQHCENTSLGPVVRLDCGEGQTQVHTSKKLLVLLNRSF
jgi:hypothetical protein